MTNMFLIADIGNTSIKLAYYKNNQQINCINFPKENINKVKLPIIKDKNLSIYIGSVVPSYNTKVVKRLNSFYKVKPVIIQNKWFLKHLDIGKISINEIGADILALALYLKVNYKKGLGICFGTATFAVAVSDKRIHGVMITPNVYSMFDSLNKTTELTKAKSFKSSMYNYFDFGDDTPKSLASGANHLTKGFVDSVTKYTKDKFGISKVCVCGGKAKVLTFLKNKEYAKKITINIDPIVDGYYLLAKSL